MIAGEAEATTRVSPLAAPLADRVGMGVFDRISPSSSPVKLNGELVKKATSSDKGSFLYRIATDPKKNNAQRINYLYEAALARAPTKDEIGLANHLLMLRKGDAPAAMQDIWWAVLNSNEFILNH